MAENKPPLDTYTSPGPSGKLEFGGLSGLLPLTEATSNDWPTATHANSVAVNSAFTAGIFWGLLNNYRLSRGSSEIPLFATRILPLLPAQCTAPRRRNLLKAGRMGCD